jgi:cell division protein FtsB
VNDCYQYQQQVRALGEQVSNLMERNEKLRRELADLQDSNAMLTAAASEHAATLKESWRRGKLLTENNIEFNQQETNE